MDELLQLARDLREEAEEMLGDSRALTQRARAVAERAGEARASATALRVACQAALAEFGL